MMTTMMIMMMIMVVMMMMKMLVIMVVIMMVMLMMVMMVMMIKTCDLFELFCAVPPFLLHHLHLILVTAEHLGRLALPCHCHNSCSSLACLLWLLGE